MQHVVVVEVGQRPKVADRADAHEHRAHRAAAFAASTGASTPSRMLLRGAADDQLATAAPAAAQPDHDHVRPDLGCDRDHGVGRVGALAAGRRTSTGTPASANRAATASRFCSADTGRVDLGRRPASR